MTPKQKVKAVYPDAVCWKNTIGIYNVWVLSNSEKPLSVGETQFLAWANAAANLPKARKK